MIRHTLESCMSMLKNDFTGTGSAREASFFNRYRILIEWILLCMHRRTQDLFTGKACLPVEPYKRDDIMSPWVVSEVMRRAHYITMYMHLSDNTRIPECSSAYNSYYYLVSSERSEFGQVYSSSHFIRFTFHDQFT